MIAKSYKQQYIHLLHELWDKGMTIKTRGLICRELLHKYIEINPNDNILTLDEFKTNISYAEEELLWYLSRTNRIDFSEVIQKTWSKYSDDGITVNSAYGYRIFGNHPDFINQWEWIKNKLEEDPQSRQCVININQCADKINKTKDFPCTLYCQVFIRENKLHWITNLRSQDIYYGMRNDVYCFTELQKLLAKELNVKLGTYIHVCNSLHIYKEQYHKIEKLLNCKFKEE